MNRLPAIFMLRMPAVNTRNDFVLALGAFPVVSLFGRILAPAILYKNAGRIEPSGKPALLHRSAIQVFHENHVR
ncbi:MAG: hypothetical protein ACU843_00045 [Gammaproteobacteria bacterium]